MGALDAGSELAAHARERRGIWSLTFKVSSIGRAADYLTGKGLRLIEQGDRSFALDPEQAFGRWLCFTEESVESYPPFRRHPLPATELG